MASQLHTQRVITQPFAREQHPSGVWSPAGRMARVVSLPSWLPTAVSPVAPLCRRIELPADSSICGARLGAQDAQTSSQTAAQTVPLLPNLVGYN